MSTLSRFQGGHNGGVFTCGSCARRTRHTQVQSNTDICEDCYELAGLENGVSDAPSEQRALFIADYLPEALKRYTHLTRGGGSYSFWTELGPAVIEAAKKGS